MENYQPFDVMHPPAVGEIVNSVDSCAMITGWRFSKYGQLFVCVNGRMISADKLFEDYTIENHPAGYDLNEED